MLEDAIRANCSVDGGVYVVTAGGAGGVAVDAFALAALGDDLTLAVLGAAGAESSALGLVAAEVSTDVWASVVTAAGTSAVGAPELPGEEVPVEERPGLLAFPWASG